MRGRFITKNATVNTNSYKVTPNHTVEASSSFESNRFATNVERPSSEEKFLCTAFLDDDGNQSSEMVCTPFPDDNRSQYIVSSSCSDCSSSSSSSSDSSSSHTSGKWCGDKIGRKEFSKCITSTTGNNDAIISDLMSQANAFVNGGAAQFATELCTGQDCPVKQCRLSNWSYAINKKGVVEDSTCLGGSCVNGKYVVEVIIIAECKCAGRKCGTNKFSTPIVLSSTQCIPCAPCVTGQNITAMTPDDSCSQAKTNLRATVEQFARSFCAQSTCNQGGARQCHLKKVEHSEIKCTTVQINGKPCCRCTVKIFEIRCGC